MLWKHTWSCFHIQPFFSFYLPGNVLPIFQVSSQGQPWTSFCAKTVNKYDLIFINLQYICRLWFLPSTVIPPMFSMGIKTPGNKYQTMALPSAPGLLGMQEGLYTCGWMHGWTDSLIVSCSHNSHRMKKITVSLAPPLVSKERKPSAILAHWEQNMAKGAEVL